MNLCNMYNFNEKSKNIFSISIIQSKISSIEELLNPTSNLIGEEGRLWIKIKRK